MKLVFYGVCVLLSLISLSQGRYVQIPVIKFGKACSIEVEVGEKRKSLVLDLNLAMDILLINSDFYYPSLDKSVLFLKSLPSPVKNCENTVLSKYKSKISLDREHSVDDIFFYYNEECFHTEYNSLPLAKNFDNDANSIINQMRNSHAISMRKFALIKIMNNPYLFIGDLPKMFLIDNPYLFTFSSNDDKKTWGINLTKVSSGRFTFRNSFYAYFQFNRENIFAPKEFLAFFKKNILSKYITANECKKENKNSDKDFDYRCECGIISSFPEITFYFGEVGFRLTGEDLFARYDDRCYLTLGLNEENEFCFGNKFILRHPAVFNFDDKSITFYRSLPFKIETQAYNKDKKIIILLVIFVQFLVIIILGFTYSRSKRLFLGNC